VVKKLFTRAKRAWGLRFDREPDWRAHMLKEADERVRELHEDESERLDAAMRGDYAPLFDFVRATRQRKTECYTLQWSEVDWSTRQITRKGKGQRIITVPITNAVRKILWPLRGHLFTYTVQRTRDGKVKGERRPITKSGLNTRWRRMRKAAGISDFGLTAFMRAVRAFAHAVGMRGLVGPRGQNRVAPSVVTSAVPGDFAHPTMSAI
jgi:integrase